MDQNTLTKKTSVATDRTPARHRDSVNEGTETKKGEATEDNKLIFNNTPITEFLYRIQPYVEQTLSLEGFSSDAVTINTIVTPSNVHTLLDSLPAAYPLEMVRTSSTITFTYSEN